MENSLPASLRGLQERSLNYFPIFLIAIVAGVFIYAYSVCCITRVQLAQNQRDVDNERRRAVAAAAAQDAADQQRNATIDNLVDGLSPSDREAFVKNFLKTDVMTVDRLKKMKASDDGGEDQAVDGSIASSKPNDEGGAAGSFISSIREASGLWSTGGEDVSQRFPHCAICLERLRVNEDIGLSQNPDCPHIFHKCCVTEWLLANKDCPVCRRKYLDLLSL